MEHQNPGTKLRKRSALKILDYRQGVPTTSAHERFAGNMVAFRTSLGRLLVVHNVYPSLSDVASKCRAFPGGPKIRLGAPSFEFAAMGSVPLQFKFPISNFKFPHSIFLYSLLPASCSLSGHEGATKKAREQWRQVRELWS